MTVETTAISAVLAAAKKAVLGPKIQKAKLRRPITEQQRLSLRRVRPAPCFRIRVRLASKLRYRAIPRRLLVGGGGWLSLLDSFVGWLAACLSPFAWDGGLWGSDNVHWTGQ